MIASLKGIVSEKLPDKIILDVAGVGYGIYVSSEDYGVLEVGQTHALSIYEYVREQAHDLFGFINRDSQNLFEKLLEVNGVGPKMALNVLSIGNLANITEAIANSDVAFIQRANGVGKRVAERIVVDLRDKIGIEGEQYSIASIIGVSSKDEAVEALVSLGYTNSDAIKALEKVDKDLPSEERVKLALKGVK